MSPYQLGRRYERLLFFSGPLTLVAIFVLLIAFTSTTQNERVIAKCLDLAVSTLKTNDALLTSTWVEYQAEKNKSKYYVNAYKYELSKVWIPISIHSGCYSDIDKFLEQGADTNPRDLATSLSKKAVDLKNTPLQFYGIEIPDKADIGVFSTRIKIKFDSLAIALQISLAPILVIWLGSLYSTRFRESLLIGKASHIYFMFPHLVNLYPAIDIPSLRKRSLIAYWFPPAMIICIIYTLIRLLLISFIVGPVVVCYLLSLYLLPISSIGWVSFTSGALVILFFFSVLVVECLPWHALKIFPGVISR